MGRTKAGTCEIITALSKKMCPSVPDPATAASSFLHLRGRFAAPHTVHGEGTAGSPHPLPWEAASISGILPPSSGCHVLDTEDWHLHHSSGSLHSHPGTAQWCHSSAQAVSRSGASLAWRDAPWWCWGTGKKKRKERVDSNRHMAYLRSFYIKMDFLDTLTLWDVWMKLPEGADNMGRVQEFPLP